MAMLEKIWDWISKFFVQYVAEPVLNIGVRDVIDILLLAFVLYQIHRFTRNRRAGRVLLGLVFVVLCSALIVAFDLPTLSYIIELVAAAAFFCVIVIFQPEIRDMFEHLGNITLLNPRSNSLSRKKMEFARSVSDETVDAVFKMSESRTGALIVFEGLTKLGDYISTGTIVDARVTSKTLQNIFYQNAPLHDGALIIRDMRILAASCVLPSTKAKMDFGTMGTRHRAAVGVTEVSDSLVIVVSEQTGTVSVAQDGKLLRNLDDKMLRDILMTYIAGNAYLRIKRANMRKEYLEMLEKVARVELPNVKSAKEEAVEKEFQKLIGATEANADEEADTSMEDPKNQNSGVKKDNSTTEKQ